MILWVMIWALVLALYHARSIAFEGAETVSAPMTPAFNYSLDDSYFYLDHVIDQNRVRRLIRHMFKHGWNNYLQHAWPADELQPVQCTGLKTLGGYMLTLVDAADTLAVMGEMKLFKEAIQRITKNLTFDLDVVVSLFETNIRMLGGLISSHIIAKEQLEHYDGSLLRLAVDLANRLLPAFDTPTGIPYGSIHLQHGVPFGETPVVCTACATSFTLEFGYLSELTGNWTYYKKAKAAVIAIWQRRSVKQLVGAHIDALTGDWADYNAGIAGGLDSFYEYLWKAYLVFHDEDFYTMFVSAYSAVEHFASRSGWYFTTNMFSGYLQGLEYYSLQAFWPGLQVSLGDLHKSVDGIKRLAHLHHYLPFLPEQVLAINGALTSRRQYPLRPEVVESVHALYRAVKEPGLLDFGYQLLKRLYTRTQTPCGFAGLEDIQTGVFHDQMDSFFLSETLKYLYLLFDDTNMFNREERWVFTTEAHPLPILVNTRRRQQLNDKADLLSLVTEDMKCRATEDAQCAEPALPIRGPLPPILHSSQKSPRVAQPLDLSPPLVKPILKQSCNASEWHHVFGASRWIQGQSWEDVENQTVPETHSGICWLRDWGFFNVYVNVS